MRKPPSLLLEHVEQLAVRGYSRAQITRELEAAIPGAGGVVGRGRPPSRRLRRPRKASPGAATRSGQWVNLLAPEASSIAAEDIAHGLACVCRFSGQTRAFYSVAQHSLMVASLVPAPVRLRALLHDATEAYLQDLPTPIKAMLPGYAEIESRLWGAIAERFGLPAHDPVADVLIKHADRIALHAEMRDLFDAFPIPGDLPAVPAGLSCGSPLPPADAEACFLEALTEALAGA